MDLLVLLAALLLALLGVPFFVLLALVTVYLVQRAETEPAAFLVNFVQIGEKPELIAIPLFTFAGYLLAESKAPERLVALTRALVGTLPGGLAIVALIACALFTALTGASGVTIVALGAVLLPGLLQAGYDRRFSLGLLTSSGSLGMLFAPALPLILYGVVAQQLTPIRIDHVFLAGLLPGLLMLVLLSVYAIWRAPPRTAASGRFDLGALWAATKAAAWELPLPFVVLGSIYSGSIAASEAAALTALYCFVVLVLIRREIGVQKLLAATRDSMVLVGAILVILGAAFALTDYLILSDVPARVLAFARTHVEQPWMFLLTLNLMLLVLGMLLEGYPAIVVLTPLLLPVALEYGIDPLHFGIIFLANLQIGLFLPPLGMNLFIAALRFERPIGEVIRSVVPFFLLLLAAVLLITYLPWLSLALVHRFGA